MHFLWSLFASKPAVRQFALLEESRVPCLDVEPQQLPIALVNRYTELKRRGAL